MLFITSVLAVISAHPTPTLLQRCQRYSVSLNLFTSIPPSADEHELKTQQISTRLYLFVLTLAFVILLVYTSTVRVIKTVNVKTPTLDQYSQMYSEHQQALVCPCKQISINYETFLQINFSLHQVCSSSFITGRWSDYLMMSDINQTFTSDDFRATGTFTFQALSAFCVLVNNTIADSLTRFNSNQYVSLSVTQIELFQLQAQSFVNQFISSTTNGFMSSLRLISETTQSNGLFSALFTNYFLYVPPGYSSIFVIPRVYSGCQCTSTDTCVQSSYIPNDTVNETHFVVPGIYIGCFLIEALLQSNLECFYSETCFNQLLSRLPSVLSFNVTVLNASSRSRFSTNSTIKALLDELMVEDWYTNITYANYYAGCQPIECTYTHETRNGAISIVTTLIGLIGGLVTALKLICPRLVKFVQWKKTRSNPEIGKIALNTESDYDSQKIDEDCPVCYVIICNYFSRGYSVVILSFL